MRSDSVIRRWRKSCCLPVHVSERCMQNLFTPGIPTVKSHSPVYTLRRVYWFHLVFLLKGSLQSYLVLSLFNLRNSKFCIVQNKSVIFSSCSGYMQTYYTFSSMAHASSEQNPFLEALRIIISLVVDLHGQFYAIQNHSANTSGWAKYAHHICAVPTETRRLGSRGTGITGSCDPPCARN